jgi:hypothetical protein
MGNREPEINVSVISVFSCSIWSIWYFITAYPIPTPALPLKGREKMGKRNVGRGGKCS